MSIDLLSLEPTKVSRDLSGKIILLYGEYKTGKTSTAVKFDRSLLLAFERGFNALSNIHAQPIDKWSDFKTILRQLKDEKVKEKFKNIIIDTADIAWDYNEAFICQKHGVTKLSDIAWGAGYKEAAKEFDTSLREIVKLGYGLILISHSEDKTFTDENGIQYDKIVPSLAKAPKKIILRMTDINGFIKASMNEDGQTRSVMLMRGTPRFEAGSRYAHIAPMIELTYENLVKALHDAIDGIQAAGGNVVEETINHYVQEMETEVEDFRKMQERLVAFCEEYVGEDETRYYAVTDIIQQYIPEGTILSLKPSQRDVLVALEQALLELKK